MLDSNVYTWRLLVDMILLAKGILNTLIAQSSFSYRIYEQHSTNSK